MKKAAAIICSVILLFTLTSCSGKDNGETTVPVPTLPETEPVTVFADTIDTENGNIIIHIAPKTDETTKRTGFWNKKDDDEPSRDAWIGICPKGDYSNEEKADEADISRGTLSENGLAVVPYAEIEAGDYLLVYCADDDGGKILATAELTIQDNRSIVIG